MSKHELRPLRFDAARCQVECASRGLALGSRIEHKSVTDSTNDDALTLAKADAAHGVVVIADRQLRGRGRRGTRWSSEPHAGLTFSVIVRARWKSEQLLVLPLVVGLAVRQVVAARVSQPVMVKWPNDVLVGGRKLCGVLVESHSHAGEIRAVVVGVGLNVRQQRFPNGLEQSAVSLEDLGATDLSLEPLLADLLLALEQRLAELLSQGFRAQHAEFGRFDFLSGRSVTVGESHGTARGIAGNGALLIECDGALRQVMAGTVELA